MVTGAHSISEAIRGAIRNEFARVSGNDCGIITTKLGTWLLLMLESPLVS
jgi:hypothetical protein